jgi:hypothetical protein
MTRPVLIKIAAAVRAGGQNGKGLIFHTACGST